MSSSSVVVFTGLMRKASAPNERHCVIGATISLDDSITTAGAPPKVVRSEGSTAEDPSYGGFAVASHSHGHSSSGVEPKPGWRHSTSWRWVKQIWSRGNHGVVPSIAT